MGFNGNRFGRIFIGLVAGGFGGFYVHGITALTIIFILAGIFEYSEAYVNNQMIKTENLLATMIGALIAVLIMKG